MRFRFFQQLIADIILAANREKKWWLVPLLVVVTLLATILIVGALAGPLAPFIYPMFQHEYISAEISRNASRTAYSGHLGMLVYGRYRFEARLFMERSSRGPIISCGCNGVSCFCGRGVQLSADLLAMDENRANRKQMYFRDPFFSMLPFCCSFFCAFL